MREMRKRNPLDDSSLDLIELVGPTTLSRYIVHCTVRKEILTAPTFPATSCWRRGPSVLLAE